MAKRRPREVLDGAPFRKDRLTDADFKALAMPSGFARGILGLKLYPWQIEVMDSLLPLGARTVLRACNESGKTSHIAVGLILWHLTGFEQGWVVSTAGAWRQIEDQLAPHLRMFQSRYPGWRFLQSSIKIGGIERYVGFSTRDAGKFEGYHGNPQAPLMIIADEAKSIPDTVYEAIERCRPQRLLIMSSPGFAEGEFYACFTSKRRFYQRFHVDYKKCPHIPPSRVEEATEKWGRDHPLVASMIYGEFMETVRDAIVPLRWIEKCLEYPPTWDQTTDRHAFCDFAQGSDENVLALRRGNKVELVDCWRDNNTAAAVGRFLSHFCKLRLEPHEISGESDGCGHNFMCDMRDQNWCINEFRSAGRAYENDVYSNRSAEVCSNGAKMIERKGVILPKDDDLHGQLIARKRTHSKRDGKLAVESKEDMRRRGLPSPDRADAVLGAMQPGPMPKSWNIVERHQVVEEQEDSVYARAGVRVGGDWY